MNRWDLSINAETVRGERAHTAGLPAGLWVGVGSGLEAGRIVHPLGGRGPGWSGEGTPLALVHIGVAQFGMGTRE